MRKPYLDRSEQWLMSIYEEDASPGAASEGEPLAISNALKDGSGSGADGVSDKEVENVRVGVIAVDVRTGKVVHDTFEEGSGQRQELHTRLRHLRSVNNRFFLGGDAVCVLYNSRRMIGEWGGVGCWIDFLHVSLNFRSSTRLLSLLAARISKCRFSEGIGRCTRNVVELQFIKNCLDPGASLYPIRMKKPLLRLQAPTASHTEVFHFARICEAFF